MSASSPARSSEQRSVTENPNEPAGADPPPEKEPAGNPPVVGKPMSEDARRRRRRRWRRAAKVAEIALRLGLAAVGSDLFDFGDGPPEEARPRPEQEPEEARPAPEEKKPEEDGHAGP